MTPIPFRKLNIRITKKEFFDAYNRNLPNKWTKFVYRYFSKEIEPEDKWLSQTFVIIESILFVAGFFGSIFDASPIFIGAVGIPFTILLFLLGILTLPAFIMNNRRIKKICKELNIFVFEYNILVDWYINR